MGPAGRWEKGKRCPAPIPSVPCHQSQGGTRLLVSDGLVPNRFHTMSKMTEPEESQ